MGQHITLLGKLPAAGAVWEPDTDLLCLNAAAQELLVLETATCSIRELLHADDQKRWSRPLSPEQAYGPELFRIETPPGHVRWIQVIGRDDHESRLLQITDVTGFKQQEEHIAATLEVLPDLLFELDSEGLFLACHTDPKRLFAPPEAFIGHRLFDVLPPHIANQIMNALEQAHQTGELTSTEYVLTIQGEERAFEARLSPSPSNTIIAVIRNITELQRARLALVQQNVQLEQFAQMASHDLQEPLRKLRSFVDLLRMDAPDLGPDAQVDMQHIEGSVQQMSTLVKALLALTTAGKQTLNLGPYNVSDALLRLGIPLGFQPENLHTSCSGVLHADPILMDQVFINLLSNSFKFRSEERPPEVVVSCTVPEPGQLLLTFEDNGIGVAADLAESIFEPLRRLNTRHRYPGSGVGLAIVRLIVDRHGGSVNASPGTSTGLRITLSLPGTPT